MSTLAFYAQFTKTLVGINSLTVTWDVEQITRSDGTRSALVTGGATSITIGRRGLYGYLLASADTKLYDYVATAITAGDVDQKEIAALWTMYEADTLKLSNDSTAADNAESFFDGTGYAGTNNTIPTVTTLTNIPAAAPSASDNATAAAAAILVTPANKLATGATGAASANVTSLAGQSEPVDNLVEALGTGGLVEKLNSMLEAAGLDYRFTADALALAPTEAGSGTGTYTDTIIDPSGNPLDGARVQLSTDVAGAHRVYEAYTNALGVVTMHPDPGTYYRWIDLAGYTDLLTQGAQVTVT